MKNWIALILVFIFSVGCASLGGKSGPEVAGRTNKPEQMDKPYVLLISIDGYRHDYTDKYKPKNLMAFRRRGSFAASLRPTFPSKTFPNHYSIVTGLHAGNHGIVANYFYSKKLDRTYKLSDRSAVTDPRFYGGTPLWVAAENAGMLSAAYFWPGSEAAIGGTLPNYYYRYDKATPHKKRVQQILDWLKLPAEKRPHLMTLYFSDVDSAGHKYGVDSPELKKAITKVDQSIGVLMEGLAKIKLPVNVVIVSDHGMTNLNSKKVLYLEDYLSSEERKGLRVVGQGPQLFIYSDQRGKISKIYKKLKFDTIGAKFRTYKRAEMTAPFRYTKSKNSGDLILTVKPPYTLCEQRQGCRVPAGSHGYNPYKYRRMHGIFYVKGPQFVAGKRIKTFNNVDIYPAILSVLGLPEKGKVDGRLSTLKSLLK